MNGLRRKTDWNKLFSQTVSQSLTHSSQPSFFFLSQFN